jgi:hypothetical protein
VNYKPIAISCFALALVGCGATAEPTQSASEDRTMSLMEVHLNPDSTKTFVTRDAVTRAQYNAMINARKQGTQPAQATEPAAVSSQAPGSSREATGEAQAAISQDTSCNGPSLWLFDSTDSNDRDFTGEYYNPPHTTGIQFDMLCLSGSGTASLGDYVWQETYLGPIIGWRYVYWPGHVAAIWPGDDGGSIWDSDIHVQEFVAGQAFTLAEYSDFGTVSLN